MSAREVYNLIRATQREGAALESVLARAGESARRRAAQRAHLSRGYSRPSKASRSRAVSGPRGNGLRGDAAAEPTGARAASGTGRARPFRPHPKAATAPAAQGRKGRQKGHARRADGPEVPSADAASHCPMDGSSPRWDPNSSSSPGSSGRRRGRKAAPSTPSGGRRGRRRRGPRASASPEDAAVVGGTGSSPPRGRHRAAQTRDTPGKAATPFMAPTAAWLAHYGDAAGKHSASLPHKLKRRLQRPRDTARSASPPRSRTRGRREASGAASRKKRLHVRPPSRQWVVTERGGALTPGGRDGQDPDGGVGGEPCAQLAGVDADFAALEREWHGSRAGAGRATPADDKGVATEGAKAASPDVEHGVEVGCGESGQRSKRRTKVRHRVRGAFRRFTAADARDEAGPRRHDNAESPRGASSGSRRPAEVLLEGAVEGAVAVIRSAVVEIAVESARKRQ